MFDALSELYKTVHVPYDCPKCGHHVVAEIVVDRPLNVGTQCPRCIELYPQEFHNALIKALEEFWQSSPLRLNK